MRQKGFAPIIVIILVFVLGAVVYFYRDVILDFAKPTIQTGEGFNSYYEQANNSLSWGNGKLIKTENRKYSESDDGIVSSLLEGKNAEVNTYSYKGKTIVLKKVTIDDFTTLEIWQYESRYDPDEGIQDFAVFRGYENNLYSATPVINIVNAWQDLYKTKSGIDMYYEYFLTPKSIGTIGLSSYWTYFPNMENSKPSLVTIYFSGIDGFATDKSDPIITEAKEKLNQIADTFTVGRSVNTEP